MAPTFYKFLLLLKIINVSKSRLDFNSVFLQKDSTSLLPISLVQSILYYPFCSFSHCSSSLAKASLSKSMQQMLVMFCSCSYSFLTAHKAFPPFLQNVNSNCMLSKSIIFDFCFLVLSLDIFQ